MQNYKRFFAFGCSFTKYKWPTWADILGKSFSEFYNFGEAGSGNFFIFSCLVKAINDFKISKNDLVIVEWSDFNREDRFKDNKWILSGPISNNKIIFDKHFVENIFDVDHGIIRDLTFIASAYELLKNTKCKFIFTSLSNLSDIKNKNSNGIVINYIKSFEKYLKYFLPSFNEIIYNNDWESKKQLMYDMHPTPIEHLEYLKKIILPNIDNIIILNENYIKQIEHIDKKLWNKNAKLQSAMCKSIINRDTKR